MRWIPGNAFNLRASMPKYSNTLHSQHRNQKILFCPIFYFRKLSSAKFLYRTEASLEEVPYPNYTEVTGPVGTQGGHCKRWLSSYNLLKLWMWFVLLGFSSPLMRTQENIDFHMGNDIISLGGLFFSLSWKPDYRLISRIIPQCSYQNPINPPELLL